jgi:hypothetical protein
MTNKTTPDNDWLSTILADLLNNTHNAPERASPMFLGDGELIDSEEDSPWQE